MQDTNVWTTYSLIGPQADINAWAAMRASLSRDRSLGVSAIRCPVAPKRRLRLRVCAARGQSSNDDYRSRPIMPRQDNLQGWTPNRCGGLRSAFPGPRNTITAGGHPSVFMVGRVSPVAWMMRGSTSPSARSQSQKPDYTTLVEHAQFLADWPLAYVDSSRWDTFRRTAAISYRPMMGDHPMVPPRRTTYPESTLEPGSLYVIDSDDQWHLLRPFLIGRDCPTCKTWLTFHVDLDHGKLVIKSLEHGQTDDGQWLAEALQHVSLLPDWPRP